MEYSTHVFIQQSPIKEHHFESKLQDISDQITTNGCTCPSVFSPLTKLVVQQAVVSSGHIAFLLEDKRICRVSFRIHADKIEANPVETTKPKSKHLTPQTIRPQSRPSVHRSSYETLILSSSSKASIASALNPSEEIDSLLQSQARHGLNRQRRHFIRTARGRAGLVFGSRPVLPASSVPEELIEQVQIVLQDKSRHVILRELQRTNLDVNMTVNNLLARDNEDDEDLDDDYIGTDFISLLDVHPHGEHSGVTLESELFDDADCTLRYSHIQRRLASARMNNPANTSSSTINPTLGSDQSAINPSTTVTSSSTSSDRKRYRYDPRWPGNSLREELFGRIDREFKPDDLSIVKDSQTKPNTSTRKDPTIPPPYQHQHSAPASIQTATNTTVSQSPILFGEQLQFWTDSNCASNTYPRFTHIACLHSELIAINTNGQLCQWNWHDEYPYQDPENPHIKHPKTLVLHLLYEKLTNLSANLIRASVLTERNCLATWMDASLGTQVNLKLQHAIQEFTSARILDLQTTPLYTIIRTDRNDLYWYGLLPNKPRKKLLERFKEKTRHKHGGNSQEVLTVGCTVCLVSNPYYHQGALGFYIHNGQPKLGQLMEQAWVLTSTARFCVKSVECSANKTREDDKSSVEMPPPPSPTCAVDSNTNFASSLKRKTSATGPTLFLSITTDQNDTEQQQHSKVKDEETWPLDEVIFIEDCQVAPTGKVVKIDGSLVLVKFFSKNNDTDIDASNLDSCRILRKDDLQIVKGHQIHKTPDCSLSLANAKRISLEHGTLLTFSVDKDCLHTLQLRDSTIHYIMYEVGSHNGSCRSIRQNHLPLINNRPSLLSFLGGNPSFIRLCTLNSTDIPRVLIDGNCSMYPLMYNQDSTNIKDPHWKNLLGINCFAQGIIPIQMTDHSNKNPIVLNIMQMRKGILIPHILRYDIEKIHAILSDLEINDNRVLLKLIFDERMDGCRNLFHACAHIGTPVTNKEYLMNDESNDIKRTSFATDLLHPPTNTDHSYGDTPQMNNLSEQSVGTRPLPSSSVVESSIPGDTQLPTNQPQSVSNPYRSLSSGATTNPGSSSTSYAPPAQSSILQYIHHPVFQQENYPFEPIGTPAASTRTDSNGFIVWSPCKYDDREKRIRALKILRLLLDCSAIQEHLFSLLSFRNLEGQTPFMSAVNSRAYHTASILFEYALQIAKRESRNDQHSSSSVLEPSKPSYQSLLLRMISPLASTNSDYSPLFTLCTNDTCSFTWTGEEHISQAIFECRTCGLSGTLCCCSECAQTCHKGHDCRLKRTSPTAYCDCWEVCKCKSLIAGDQQKRLDLLKILLNETNLVQMKNARHEHILLYLVQTVGRQLVEQQQFTRISTATRLQQQAKKTRELMINNPFDVGAELINPPSKKVPGNQMDIEANSQTPDHHLEPPQFCRRALEVILADWCGVKSMLLSGCPDDFDLTINNLKQTSPSASASPPTISSYNNETIFSIDEQQQTSQLDRFTYFLLVKCNITKQSNDFLDLLLNTLIRQMSNSTDQQIARYVTARFVRSVIRLFMMLSLQSVPEQSSTTSKRVTTNASTLTASQSVLLQCKRIFQTLTDISIEALVHMADLLVAPVRYGLAKPTAMFNLLSAQTDILQSLDEVFNIDSPYYRAYQHASDAVTTNDDLNETAVDNSTMNTNVELTEEDENNSDTQSQHEIVQVNANERQTRRDNVIADMSDNESEMELELLAESDSDNESNHSALNAHRISAIVESENMASFSDDDNSESDDVDSVLGEGDESSQLEPMIFEETRDTLATTAPASSATATSRTISTNDRSSLVSSTNNNPAGSNAPTVSSTNSHLNAPRLTTIAAITASLLGDNHSRRQTTPAASSTNQPTPSSQPANTISINTTNCLLARAFGILIRQATDLLVRWPTALSTTTNEHNTIDTIQKEIEQCLVPSWKWFATVMDSFEYQLRFGMSLSNLRHNENDTTLHGNRFFKSLIDRVQTETKKKSSPNRTTTSSIDDKPVHNRLDSLHYSLSLMRSTHEHGDQEPLLDVLTYKHLAYLLDGFIYYFRENDPDEITSGKEVNDENSTNEETNTITSNHSFFQRSPSTLCLSSLGPDPFQITIDHSLPLACRPQLLQPICRKEDLFGRFLYDQTAARYSHIPSQLSLAKREQSIPEFLQPNYLKSNNSTTNNTEDVPETTDITTRDDDRMAVGVLLDLSAGVTSSNQSSNKQAVLHSILFDGSHEYLLARWRFSIELFAKLFMDDVGIEPGSIINQSGGFSAREQRFRHDMERLKNTHQKDIRFEAMERDRVVLIQKTFRTLNLYYHRNQSMNSSSSIPPLAVQRVKVTFKDEAGVGSGVARSFYASIVEAILSEENLPILELGNHAATSTFQSLPGSLSSSHAQRQHRSSRERRTALATYLRSDRRSTSMLLSSEARPFKLNLSSSSPLSGLSTNTSDSSSSLIEHWTPSKIKIGLNLYPKVAAIQPFHAEKITGMLLDGLPTTYLQRMISVDGGLRTKVDEAMHILTAHSTRETQLNDPLTTRTSEQLVTTNNSMFDKQLNEFTPLFWQPDKKGVYALRPGKCTPERLAAYRNVGRLIGLCLLQNELFLLPLCRHVIKYILNRPIRWHDLAFFDSAMYENLRRMVFDAKKNEPHYVTDLQLTFSMTVTEKEGGETYDLIPDGSSKDVTHSNLYEFIKCYAEFRLVHLVEQSLQHLRLGVYDVLPPATLDDLSPEDFRLLLNGTSNINVTTLMTYTTFNDESGETNERTNQFKKWFWAVLEQFHPLERQDLVHFWTGSPALPASEGGFQPQPSVTIRPADDHHLPTANTCISRLYVPLYSSKTILKSKLQYAIQTKMFGFV